MSTDTIFYIVGSIVAVLAVLLSFAGLKLKGFPSRGATGGIIAIFAVLVIATSGLAVAVARHEQDQRRAEQAEAHHQTAESAEPTPSDTGAQEAAGAPDARQGGNAPQGAGSEQGGGETLEVAASETELAYNKTELDASAGEVTIEFDNPATIPHDVVIRERGGEDIARTDVITEGSDSVTADLASGEYAFYCSVPGHEEAGMVGTLTVE